MATDSVMGLFATPEQLQQQQYQQAFDRNLQLAKLNPRERNVAMLGTSVDRLGSALGGALGGQDPQLQMATARRQILRNVNPQDMKSIEEAAVQFSRMGDGAGIQAMQELAFKQSQITKNLREGRAAANKVVEANGRQYLINSATGEQIADLGAASDKSTKVTVSPQIKLPMDVNALASGYEKAIEGDVSVKNLAGTAKGLINQATTSNNASAWEAARTQVAKAVGEGKLSNEDIARTGIDPTLIGGVRDWIDKKVVGVPDVKTQQALYTVASYLEKTAGGRISEKRNNRIAMAKQANPDIDAASMFPDYSGAVQTTAGGGKIVDFKDFGKKGK